MTNVLVIKATGKIIQIENGGPFEVPPDLEWLVINDPVTQSDSIINGEVVPGVPTITNYIKLRKMAYIEAELTPENYIDEVRKERLGQSNNLAAMDAAAEQIKLDYPAT